MTAYRVSYNFDIEYKNKGSIIFDKSLFWISHVLGQLSRNDFCAWASESESVVLDNNSALNLPGHEEMSGGKEYKNELNATFFLPWFLIITLIVHCDLSFRYIRGFLLYNFLDPIDDRNRHLSSFLSRKQYKSTTITGLY